MTTTITAAVNPARAGMIPGGASWRAVRTRKPRASGDDPPPDDGVAPPGG